MQVVWDSPSAATVLYIDFMNAVCMNYEHALMRTDWVLAVHASMVELYFEAD